MNSVEFPFHFSTDVVILRQSGKANDGIPPYSIDELRRIIAPIAQEHGVESVSLFGSYSRGTASAGSDYMWCRSVGVLLCSPIQLKHQNAPIPRGVIKDTRNIYVHSYGVLMWVLCGIIWSRIFLP